MPPPTTHPFDPDHDILILVSDGVYDIFPAKNIPPLETPLPTCQTVVDSLVQLVQSEISKPNSDPDDVTMVVLKIEQNDDLITRHEVKIEDITERLYPEFKAEMKLPWCEYSYNMNK